MSPKRSPPPGGAAAAARPAKARRSGGAAAADPPMESSGEGINGTYYTNLTKALNIIKKKWPKISTMDPLPESNGFMAPFNPETFDALFERRVRWNTLNS